MKKIILGGVCATTLVISAAVSVVSCGGDEEYYKNGNYTLANKRVTRGAPGDPDRPNCPSDFLDYSNCGLWGVAQMSRGADNYTKQSLVLSAAKYAINWNEDENMSNRNNNSTVRALNGEEILSVCRKVEEVYSKEGGYSRYGKLGNLPNTYEKDPCKAKELIEDMKANMGKNNKVSGVLVGVDVYVDGELIHHWVPLESFDGDDLLVRDPLTRNRYKDMENRGVSDESTRYKQTYGMSSVRALLYRKN